MLATATGRVNSHTAAVTSIDHEKGGTSSRLMPVGRSEITVVATTTAPSSSPAITRPVPSSVSAMASFSLPVTPSTAPQPPPASADETRITAPMSHVQNDASAARGKATLPAPIWEGTTARAAPRNSGITTSRSSDTRYSVQRRK